MSADVGVAMSMMARLRNLLASVLLSAGLVERAGAQIPLLPKEKDSTPPQAEVTDPFGRDSPRGTIMFFNEAVRERDFATATRYLQLTPAQRANADSLASHLNELMERYFSQSVTTISDSPDGARDDALPADRERVGPLVIDEQRVDVGLVRVNDPLAGSVWLIASETVAQVPALQRAITATWIERRMHPALVRRQLFGASLAQWIALAASLAIPLLLLPPLISMLVGVARRTIDDPARLLRVDRWHAGLRKPAVLVLALLLHLSAMSAMGLALTFRLRYGRLVLTATVVAVAWLIRRLLGLSFDRARSLMPGSAHSGARSLLLLFERLIKAFVLVVAVVTILTMLGVDTKTALAGVGIGGIAIALGAQKTVENLLGGIFLLSDKALAVGDVCTIGNRTGVVEDITLRSVRLRTLEQTLLSVPAGTLSQSNVENLSSRGKMLVQSRLRLRYGTRADQIRSILDATTRALVAHPKVETDTFRVRLMEFSERAIEIELFAYAQTTTMPEYLVIREELLLQVATIVESSGSGFAQPTQFVYMERDAGLETVREGSRTVSRDESEIPVSRARESSVHRP